MSIIDLERLGFRVWDVHHWFGMFRGLGFWVSIIELERLGFRVWDVHHWLGMFRVRHWFEMFRV